MEGRYPSIWGSRTDLLGTPKPMGPTQQGRTLKRLCENSSKKRGRREEIRKKVGRGKVTSEKTGRGTEARVPELARDRLAAIIEASEVVSGSSESPFNADRRETTPSKPTHSPLLLQDSKHRLD